MNRQAITFVVVVVLCAIGWAYSQGWLGGMRSGIEIERERVGTEQTIGEENANMDVPVTKQISVPDDKATE
jgi:hypothetical protein